MSGSDHVGYTEGFVAQVQLLWGEGFISPGGAGEVARAVEGVDLRGKEVLDVGVGLAGPACLLVKSHGAARVTGIDVQEAVLTKAAALVRGRGLAERVLLRHVGPGPLPFAPDSAPSSARRRSSTSATRRPSSARPSACCGRAAGSW